MPFAVCLWYLRANTWIPSQLWMCTVTSSLSSAPSPPLNSDVILQHCGIERPCLPLLSALLLLLAASLPLFVAKSFTRCTDDLLRSHVCSDSDVVTCGLAISAVCSDTSHCDIRQQTVKEPLIVGVIQRRLCAAAENYLGQISCRNALFQQIYVTVSWDVSAWLLFGLWKRILRIVGSLKAMSTLIQINLKLLLSTLILFFSGHQKQNYKKIPQCE